MMAGWRIKASDGYARFRPLVGQVTLPARHGWMGQRSYRRARTADERKVTARLSLRFLRLEPDRLSTDPGGPCGLAGPDLVMFPQGFPDARSI